jgi:dihydroorotase
MSLEAMPPELLRQVRLLDPLAHTDQVADVLIEGGVIQAIAPQIRDYPDQAEITDCAGFILGPGLVDLYSTVGEPGFESRETLNSIAAAAVAGGFTRVALLPSTHPAIDSAEQVEWMLIHSPHHLPVKLQPWAALTQNLEGQKLVELSELTNTDICGFSDGQPLKPGTLVRHALEYLKPLQTKPLRKCIMLWPCDRTLAANGVIREGIQALQTGLPENPVMAETTALAALIEIVETLQIPVHIMRVSTARSVEILKAAKDRGLPITASTTWMHLLWSSKDLHSYNVHLRLDPPIGNPSDQAALILGLETGVIDAIAIDHQPHTYEEKTVPFAEAPPGAIGLELALPLLWQAFVSTQRWSALDLWARLSTNPLKILNQTPTTIAENQRAAMTLFDPIQPWEVDTRSLQSLSSNTPWLGSTLVGRAVKTWLTDE